MLMKNTMSLKMQIKDYSDVSFVLHGEETKTHKEKIKELGGRYNRNLKDIGSGWVFSMKKKNDVIAWLKDDEQPSVTKDLPTRKQEVDTLIARGENVMDSLLQLVKENKELKEKIEQLAELNRILSKENELLENDE